eukprot:TRINITY_DN13450_c0_g3_i1.p1 TRINITY_DN13450_c0_g3~~TRINITY_DN13450_c0_g3_i1.p1  ORF type:complete len:119 (+),score=37.24 TRINITY_DN13450_c0_g3_i1:258-614(+)
MQFREDKIKRELVKAYSGFYMRNPTTTAQISPIATGNWGCGSYGGHPELKAIIQWMAASKAGRDLVYHTYNKITLAQGLTNLKLEFSKDPPTIGMMYKIISTFNMKNGSLLQHILKTI